MPPQKDQPFLEKAEDRLAGLRGSLLLFAQGRLAGAEIIPACRRLAAFQFEAETAGYTEIGHLAAEVAYSVERFSHLDGEQSTGPVNAALDLLSKLEAKLLSIPLGSDGFGSEADELLELRFSGLGSEREKAAASHVEAFEIDDDTLEIFQEEAEGLLTNIGQALSTLRSSPSDTTALWEIRRNAHTLKGAAGIVGLSEASSLAHSVEDLLDELVASNRPPEEDLITVLQTANDALASMAGGTRFDAGPALKEELARLKNAPMPASPPISGAEVKPVHTPPTPVVRVSLDRLDELLDLSARLAANADKLTSFAQSQRLGGQIADLLSEQQRLSSCVRSGLQQIRMVRFGVLFMRLNRAVNVTCQEEGKKAVVVINDPDVEVDTLIIDALIEPLLHLLKNAVVHGIESPERRRLLGKPEEGRISVGLETKDGKMTISIEDDGRGISSAALVDKAIKTGLLDPSRRDDLTEDEAFQMIFERGLTTAENITLNAGRGVGMSIAKESIEGSGGTIEVVSEPQQGTKFTITFPVASGKESPASTTDGTAPPLILIVDDSNSIRLVTSRMVEALGCRAITAENGEDALELLLARSLRPDLILSDVEMPVMDGWQFLEAVKAAETLRGIPVVMVTSLAAEACRLRAIDLGADDYVVKPLELNDVGRLVRTFVSSFVA